MPPVDLDGPATGSSWRPPGGAVADPVELTPAVRKARAEHPVALVSMPFVWSRRPSLQVGLLAAIASEHGFPASTMNLNLDFAQQVGPEIYEPICDAGFDLGIGGWMFSVAAFGDAAPDRGGELLGLYPDELGYLLDTIGKPVEYLREMREREVPRYVDRLMETVDWGRFAVVGFSCRFDQDTASFAMAKRIKQAYPQVTTLFGGSNFEGPMGVELTRAVECVDYAVIGEGDQALPEFLIAHQEGRDPADVPGVVCRRDGVVREPRPRPLFAGLDQTPFPDYDEYFERAARLGVLPAKPPRLPFESSRGCWWGQKHQCTFCGLNGLGMAFRSKSPQRVRAELDHAAARWNTHRFAAVDNIMDMSYMQTLLPALAADDPGYELFYELKANLTREQVALLRRAGVRLAQPGIESLSSHVLQLMDKGTTALQNINLLRWAEHYGIFLNWNVLYGFPGETPEDYRQVEATIPHLHHLQPPVGVGPIRVERFSPMFDDPARFPARYRRPRAIYPHIYPNTVDLEQAAYSFDHEFEQALPDTEYEPMRRLCQAWHETWAHPTKPSLTFELADGELRIDDRRDPARPVVLTVAEPLATLYTALSDRPRNPAKVAAELGLLEPTEELTAALDEFCAHGLMLREGNAFLSLALPSRRAQHPERP